MPIIASRKILATCALPYANGPIHLGYLVECIQADIWVRFQKMRGHSCFFICGDDTHGTPIMLAAKQAGITPEALIARIYTQHQADLAGFHIGFDHYSTTHSEENRQLAELFYQRLSRQGDITVRTISQAYDPSEQLFLPDRYVKGECPSCHTPDQYGDNCEVCGAVYSPLDLVNPRSVISGVTPIARDSEHYFFRLSQYSDFLFDWIQAGHLQPEVCHKLLDWFKQGLEDLDISRDAPYFGFKIPGTEDKFFYVWLDAPMGYIAIFKDFCRKIGANFEDYWLATNTERTELYHFIGKDIIKFHAIFWPALLKGAGFRLPTALFTHGYLTINGLKMSKSRGTFIKASTYLKHLEPEYLRYYFAAKLNDRVEDIDLNFNDFLQRVNADLIGKVVNIASRCARFINQYFENRLSATLPEKSLLNEFVSQGETIANAYEAREFNRAVRTIMELADKANHYIDSQKPWALIKQSDQFKRTHEVCSLGIHLFRLLILYLKPILPVTAARTEDFLNSPELTWECRQTTLCSHAIKPFTPLLQRVTLEQITALQRDTA